MAPATCILTARQPITVRLAANMSNKHAAKTNVNVKCKQVEDRSHSSKWERNENKEVVIEKLLSYFLRRRWSLNQLSPIVLITLAQRVGKEGIPLIYYKFLVNH